MARLNNRSTPGKMLRVSSLAQPQTTIQPAATIPPTTTPSEAASRPQAAALATEARPTARRKTKAPPKRRPRKTNERSSPHLAHSPAGQLAEQHDHIVRQQGQAAGEGDEQSAGQIDATEDDISERLDTIKEEIETDPQQALESYRVLWQEHKIQEIAAPAVENHPKHEPVRVQLQAFFDFTYCNPTITDKDIRSNVHILQSEKFEWHNAMSGLRLYAQFGKDGLTRIFMIDLRKLAGMRGPATVNSAAEGSAQDSQKQPDQCDETTCTGLTFAQAVDLLDEARHSRLLREGTSRGDSKTAAWRPKDCRVAKKLAQERFNMHSPPKATSTRKSKRVPQQPTPESEVGEERENGSEDEGDTTSEQGVLTERGGNTGQNGGQSGHVMAGQDSIADEEDSAGRVSTTDDDDAQHDDSVMGCDADLAGAADGQFDRDGGDSSPEREQGRGVAAHNVLEDRPSFADVDESLSFNLWDGPTPPFPTTRATNPATTLTSQQQQHVQAREHQQTRHRHDDQYQQQQLKRYLHDTSPSRSSLLPPQPEHLPSPTRRLHDSPPASPPVDQRPGSPGHHSSHLADNMMKGGRTNKRKRDISPTPSGLRGPAHGEGQTSAFKRTYIDAANASCDANARPWSDVLRLARTFLTTFSAGCHLRDSIDTESRHDFLTIFHSDNDADSNVDDGQAPYFFLALIAPRIEDPMPEHDVANHAGWALVCMQRDDAHAASITVYADSSTINFGTLRACVPAELAIELEGVSDDSHIRKPLPTHLDVHNDDPSGFIRCIAAATCYIVDVPLPDKIFVWAWIGALAVLSNSQSRGRISEVMNNMELPELPVPTEGAVFNQTRSKASLTTIRNGLDAFETDLITLANGASTLRDYSKSLQLIRQCADAAPQPPTTAFTADIDSIISTCTSFLTSLESTDPNRSAAERMLQDYERRKAEALAKRGLSGGLRDLVTWTSMSLGEVAAVQQANSNKKAKLVNELGELVNAGQAIVDAHKVEDED